MKGTVSFINRPRAAATSAAADALPTRLKMLDWGLNPNARETTVNVGATLLANLQRPEYPFREVALDFEHNTVEGTPAYKESKEPRPVAAYCSVDVVPNDGVYFNVLRWTSDGRKNSEHYQDLSATPLIDDAGNVVAVASGAICRVGAAPKFTLRQLPLSWAAALNALTSTQTKDSSMTLRESIIKLLKLDADTPLTDEELAAKLAESLAAAATTKPAEGTPAPLSAALAPILTRLDAIEAAATKPGTVVPLSAAALVPLTTRLDAIEAASAQRERQGVLDTARFAGKVVNLSAAAVAKLSLADLQELVDKTPVTVPLSAITPPHSGGGGAGEAGLLARYEAMPAGEEKDKYLSANASAINNARVALGR